MRLTAVVARFHGLASTELLNWIERGWVSPVLDDPEPEFRDIDVARVRLIHDLRFQMCVEEDMIPMVLSLLDQVYELRGQLRSLVQAVESQPEEIRRRILAAME